MGDGCVIGGVHQGFVDLLALGGSTGCSACTACSRRRPCVVTGTDVARITEAQNLLHRTFLEQVAQTARTLGEARRPALPFAAGGGPGSEAEGEEW